MCFTGNIENVMSPLLKLFVLFYTHRNMCEDPNCPCSLDRNQLRFIVVFEDQNMVSVTAKTESEALLKLHRSYEDYTGSDPSKMGKVDSVYPCH